MTSDARKPEIPGTALFGGAIAKGLQQDPYFKPFFDGFPPVHAWLAKAKPDVAVVALAPPPLGVGPEAPGRK
jgi:hypothetical protein